MNQDLIKDFFSLFCIPLQNEVFLNIFRNFQVLMQYVVLR